MSSVCLNKITIIGVGLIGGSFALGLKRAGLVKKVVGFGRNEEALKKGVELGVLDDYTLDMQTALDSSDLVFLAVPLGAMQAVLAQMKPFLADKTIITDGGSAKMSVIQSAEAVFGQLPTNFVPGHPIAGKEKSGVEAADAHLYEQHRVILTPTEQTEQQAIQTVSDCWQAIGAEVSFLEPAYHDEVLAATSHLPHLLAYGLVDLLHEHEELGSVFQYTAGGFRDFTRIASSDAVMWRDIALYNKIAIAKWLKNYRNEIDHLIELVETEDADQLYELFQGAKNARNEHILK